MILSLYSEKGPDMVYDLRGMYAFAIWDENKQGLFLARDPFGIKPLYYFDNGQTIRVASQVKALIKGGKINNSTEPAGHVGFFYGAMCRSLLPYTKEFMHFLLANLMDK